MFLPRQFGRWRAISSTPWISPARSVGSRLPLAGAAEVEQLLGDVLAAERLLLDHLQVARQHLGVGRARRRPCAAMRQHVLQPAFQGLGAEGDAGQRVVDLVGHAGGQEADRHQPLAADELPAALVDLPGQVGVDRRAAGRSCR